METIDPTLLRLAAVVESSDDAIISQTVDGIIETWNRAAERMFGFTADEAVGHHIDLIVPPDRRSEEQGFIARLQSGGVVSHFDTMARTRTGALIPISLSISPVLTPDGDVIGISRIARDISDRWALERQKARLAAIVDSSEDAIISKDLNGLVQTWNSAAERMFGYSAADMIGAHISRIIPADRLKEEDMFLARVREGGAIDHFETVRRRRDGSLLDVALSISPIKTADGTIVGASKIARDVSIQRVLEREAFRLAAIVDSSEDAIVSKDLNGIVRTWNPAAERMFGYSAAEMIGESILKIIPANRRQEEDDVLSRIRARIKVEHFQTVRRRKDGSFIEVSLSVSPIKTASGAVIGASKIARDVTRERLLARQLEEANRVKDEFLAMLSHELRTPLNAVLGYTSLLRSGHLGEGRTEAAIEIIERNAKMLSQLVSDVLDVSSIVTGKIRVEPVPCDLLPVMRAALDVVRPSAEAKGVALREVAVGPALPAHCDVARMQQVFWNLLSNAVKFTPRGGAVTVTLAEQDGHAVVTVEDTGIGIPPGSLPYVFHRFWQGETVDGRTGGLGLGLALSRHFVELHGGTIAAASGGEGKGATFTVTLPLRT